MKFIILFGLCLVSAFTSAAPVDPPSILIYDSNNDGLGNYNFAFETSDGIKRQEQSEVVNAGDPDKVSVIVRGSYSYTGPDGVVYSVNYIADESGFKPQGAHLPVVGLARSIEGPVQSPTPGLVASLLG